MTKIRPLAHVIFPIHLSVLRATDNATAGIVDGRDAAGPRRGPRAPAAGVIIACAAAAQGHRGANAAAVRPIEPDLFARICRQGEHGKDGDTYDR